MHHGSVQFLYLPHQLPAQSLLQRFPAHPGAGKRLNRSNSRKTGFCPAPLYGNTAQLQPGDRHPGRSAVFGNGQPHLLLTVQQKAAEPVWLPNGCIVAAACGDHTVQNQFAVPCADPGDQSVAPLCAEQIEQFLKAAASAVGVLQRQQRRQLLPVCPVRIKFLCIFAQGDLQIRADPAVGLQRRQLRQQRFAIRHAAENHTLHRPQVNLPAAAALGLCKDIAVAVSLQGHVVVLLLPGNFQHRRYGRRGAVHRHGGNDQILRHGASRAAGQQTERQRSGRYDMVTHAFSLPAVSSTTATPMTVLPAPNKPRQVPSR